MAASMNRKLWHTPLRDLVRFRITGRLDLKAVLASSGLPAELQAVVRNVAKRTRLWRIERIDIAHELIAHFADGLAAGETPQTLLENFGDARAAATLIRRAKRRGRPLVWHVFNFFKHAFAALVAFYIGSGIYYFMGRPTISHDYLAELNAPILATPAEDRAWPIYRDVLVELRQEQGEPTWKLYWSNLLEVVDRRPGNLNWAATAGFLIDHTEMLDRIRVAAAKPVLGYVYGPGGSFDDPALCDQTRSDSPLFQAVNDSGQGRLRVIASMLGADARLAMLQGDSVRVFKNLRALDSMARQLRSGLMMSQIIGIGLREYQLEIIDEALSTGASKLDEEELVSLAHQLSAARTASDVIDFSTERMLFADYIQRAYTDNGSGDGRIARRGLLFISGRQTPIMEEILIGGPLAIVTLSRKEAQAEYDAIMAGVERNFAKPIREVELRNESSRSDGVRRSWLESTRMYPITVWMPSLDNAQMIAERMLGHRDGVVAAIAMELYRRKNGKYPENVEALVPTYLPATPVDRITGEPVKIRAAGGFPLIYSVGEDRIDDEGTPYLDRRSTPDPNRAASWRPGGKVVRGDWILFPQSRFAQPEEAHGDVNPDDGRPATQPAPTSPNK